MADPDRLEQVFVNLLINARDALEEKFYDRANGIEEKKITLKTYVRKKDVVIEVCDTGAGIPERNLNKIFEPFFTTKEVGKGTGLGLSISYQIIKDCKGDITVRSIFGKGATFVVTFPLIEKNNG